MEIILRHGDVMTGQPTHLNLPKGLLTIGFP